MTYTDLINLTNDELLTLACTKEDATSLETELAQRLEEAMRDIDAWVAGDTPTLDDVIEMAR